MCLCMHVIGLSLLFAVLHGKQLRAVLTKFGPPASLSLPVPGYLAFSAFF